MTGYIGGEMNFTKNIIMDSNISEEDGLSSSSITPSSMEEMTLSYPTRPTGSFLIPSGQQVPGSLMEGFFYPPYYHPRNIYSSSVGDQKYMPSNDHFISSSPSSSESCGSMTHFPSNPFHSSINHATFFNERHPHSSQEDFANYTLHNFDCKSSSSSKNSEESKNSNESPASSVQTNDGGKLELSRKHKQAVSLQDTNYSDKKSSYAKRHSRNKDRKRCSNCHTTQSPSWRRSTSESSLNALLCNACGLYEKTARRKRMLVTQDDGATKVVRKRDVRGYYCSKCGVKDATRWRRIDGAIQCDKCVRGRK